MKIPKDPKKDIEIEPSDVHFLDEVICRSIVQSFKGDHKAFLEWAVKLDAKRQQMAFRILQEMKP